MLEPTDQILDFTRTDLGRGNILRCTIRESGRRRGDPRTCGLDVSLEQSQSLSEDS